MNRHLKSALTVLLLVLLLVSIYIIPVRQNVNDKPAANKPAVMENADLCGISFERMSVRK